MGGYAKLPAETKATLQEIARLSYGSSVFEGRKGGGGRMGALVEWSRERAKKVSGSSLLKIFEDGAANWPCGMFERMFKDKKSRDIAIQIMGLLDIGRRKILGDALFLGMLPGAVNDLRTNGFSRPLTRERLCAAFAVDVPAGQQGAALDVGAFTDKFVSGLYDRLDNDIGGIAASDVVRFCDALRYESALALKRNPNRGVGRDDFFVIPSPLDRFGREGEEDPGRFLQESKMHFVRDGLRNSNVVFSFMGETLLQQGLNNQTLIPTDFDLSKSAGRMGFVNGVAGKIRALMPGMTDLQLARVLFLLNQNIDKTLNMLDPTCKGSENFSIECTAGAKGAVHVKITPRSEDSGDTVVGRFLVELDVGRNGQVRLTRLKSRGKEWKL